MSNPTDGDLNSNVSDFDQSDEDIASLLADDEEDILAKTILSKSPPKKKTEQALGAENAASKLTPAPVLIRKDSKPDLGSPISPKIKFSKSLSKENDDPDSDALNDILADTALPSFLKKSSTDKDLAGDIEEDALSSFGKSRKASVKSKDSFFNSFFKNLSSPKDSPEKSSASISLDKKGKVLDNDDDILKSLKTEEKASSKGSDSYFDSFLKNISPKASPKKNLVESEARRISVAESKDDTDEDDNDLLKSLDESDEEHSPVKRKDSYKDSISKSSFSPKSSPIKTAKEITKRNETKKKELESDEEDIFGKSSSLETRKSNPVFQKQTSLDKRKAFVKQVSFKGIPDTFPENDSPTKQSPLQSPKRQPQPTESEAKTKLQPRRSEKMGKDDTDWLSFFKESPKKTKTQPSKEDKPPNVNAEFKSGANRRRSSSAEWLGLSESDLADKGNDVVLKDTPPNGSNFGSGDQTRSVRPKSTPVSSTKVLDDDLSWLGESRGVLSDKRLTPEKERFGKSLDLVEGEGNENVPHVADLRRDFIEPEEVYKSTNTSVAESGFVSKLSNDVSSTTNYPADLGLQKSLPHIQNSAVSLQTVINNHLLEKEHLVKSSEAMRQMYEERIKTIEAMHKAELESYKDAMKVLEMKLKSELDSQLTSKEEKLNLFQNEQKQIEKDFKEKLAESEKSNLKEIARLKELHNQSVMLMKQDHEDALLRLKRLKEQEIEAILSTQSHAKSLQHLTEQLEARAAELASLQTKVEDRNQSVSKEKQALLEAKEKDLKNLQIRVEKQLEEGDSERSRLQQLVLRLESRLQKYTTEGEEDRWEVQQMKARLSVQQKHLDEEYKMQLQQVEREKEKLHLAQDSLLHEQKTVLMQLAQERQQLMREKVGTESIAKKLKEDENVFHVKRMKEESLIESQKQFIQQEESRLRLEKNALQQESELLEREKQASQRDRQLLQEEKMKINEFNYKLKRRETEVEMMAMSASEDKEHAQAEHASAFKIQTEQQNRMQQISRKMHEVMEKEQQILIEKENLSEERLELENKKKTIVCNKCKLSLGMPVNAPPLPSLDHVAINTPVANLPISNVNQLEAFRHDPSLVVWYITAQRDREYLQEEMAFLKSLKDSSTARKKL